MNESIRGTRHRLDSPEESDNASLESGLFIAKMEFSVWTLPALRTGRLVYLQQNLATRRAQNYTLKKTPFRFVGLDINMCYRALESVEK